MVSPQVLGQETEFHEADARDRREGPSEAHSDSGVVTVLGRGCSRAVEVESEAGG